jgi:hypothetical protein
MEPMSSTAFIGHNPIRIMMIQQIISMFLQGILETERQMEISLDPFNRHGFRRRIIGQASMILHVRRMKMMIIILTRVISPQKIIIQTHPQLRIVVKGRGEEE